MLGSELEGALVPTRLTHASNHVLDPALPVQLQLAITANVEYSYLIIQAQLPNTIWLEMSDVWHVGDFWRMVTDSS